VKLMASSFSICSHVMLEFLEVKARDKSDMILQKPLSDTTDFTFVYKFMFKT